MLVFGEDVGRKGGVYGVTRGLQQRFGAARVFDTLLDEQAILGMGLGFGVSGLLPMPEIQYLAYLHNAEDQLRGEAASLRFFSDGAFTNPMVVRIAGLGYQKGFGGHFHNDNAVAVLRDIPGLVVAVPSRPEDAAPMLRTLPGRGRRRPGRSACSSSRSRCTTSATCTRPGDRGWLGAYAARPAGRRSASGRTHGDGSDLTIVTFGNGVRMSLRVARRLATQDKSRPGCSTCAGSRRYRVADLLREAEATGRVLIVDETRHSGGVGEGILTALLENGFTGRVARVSSRDSFVPLGDAANLVLLGEDEIERAALRAVRPACAPPPRTVAERGSTRATGPQRLRREVAADVDAIDCCCAGVQLDRVGDLGVRARPPTSRCHATTRRRAPSFVPSAVRFDWKMPAAERGRKSSYTIGVARERARVDQRPDRARAGLGVDPTRGGASGGCDGEVPEPCAQQPDARWRAAARPHLGARCADAAAVRSAASRAVDLAQHRVVAIAARRGERDPARLDLAEAHPQRACR